MELSITPKKKDPFEHGPFCHECNVLAGAVMPKDGLMGVTVWCDECGSCGERKTVVPASDYHWPKQGRKAIFD